ncbi:MAG: RHS repeat-associated core domain-containing protein [Chitinophagaceae bacterium]|nr:RHS repeat-associated core domain-containing protein [Chitinophagaceae bacterium]
MYVSNQSDQDVYFDNLQVGITAGNIIEENHYYAYGLKIAGISSKKLGDSFEGMLKNTNLYNDKELFDDGDLNWYDYGFRNYDPQIGRFTQLDPLTDDYPQLTPYQYASNDPIGNIDIDGLEGGVSTFATAGEAANSMASFVNDVHDLGEVVVTASRVSSTVVQVGSKASSLGSILKTLNTITTLVRDFLSVMKTVDDTKSVGATNKFLSFKNGRGNEVAYFETGNVVSTTTDADIDTDGDISDVPKSERIKDESHINSVASGQNVHPYSYNYDVLPKEQKYLSALRANGVKIRGVYALIYKGHTTFGTNEDTGPADQSTNGEFSPSQINDAGMAIDKKTGNGGTDENSIQVFYFKNSEQHFYKDKGRPWFTGGRRNVPTQEQVNQLGEFLLNRNKSGVEKLQNHMNKNVKHVKNYD